jgi:predicted AAA+ superfamily ATPase
MIRRTIDTHVLHVLNDWGKIALLSGPRQVGKTTLARDLQAQVGQGTYFNWDVVADQRRFVADPDFFEKADRDPAKPSLVVLDEIHKYARWKNWLKGAWDGHHDEFRFLVTGSGRLDLFRKGADSLMGRAIGVPLSPLSVGEVAGTLPSWDAFKAGLDHAPAESSENLDAYRALLRFGGFPEPFVRAEEAFHNVWHQERKTMLIRQDIRDATRIREVSLLEVLSHLVPPRVGSPLSVNSLREDVGVAFETVRDWLLVLEQFYYLFRVTPWSKSVARSLKKEAKVYLYDWVEVPGDGPRFENLVAMHLLKAVTTWRALGAGDVELHYVRDKEKREVDFVLTEGGQPVCLVECKSGDETPSPALRYFQGTLGVPTAVQLVNKPGICRKSREEGRSLWVVSADRWLAMLP